MIKLEEVKLESERQSQIVIRMQMIGKCTGYIQVAGADFIKGRNATGEETLLIRNVETETLAHEDMCTHTGRETIISSWIPVGLLRPEFITEYCVEV